MPSNESMEMYLETIYLLENNHGHAHGVEIANKLGVSKASVSKATKQLKAKGLIHKESYGTITLTEKGREISEKIYLNHKMITNFLEHSLGLSSEIASKNACKIEHVLSEEMVTAISEYLNRHNIEV